MIHQTTKILSKEYADYAISQANLSLKRREAIAYLDWLDTCHNELTRLYRKSNTDKRFVDFCMSRWESVKQAINYNEVYEINMFIIEKSN